MPNEEYTKSQFLAAMLRQQKQALNAGGSLVNPSIPQSNDLGQLATLNTGVQKPVEQEKQVSGFDQFMNNVLGFVDEIAAKFGAGFVAGWEGGLDLIATGLGALGWDDAAEWAKQDIGTAAAEWTKTAFGLGQWYNRFKNNSWSSEEWDDVVSGFGDLNKSIFFANTDLQDMRSELSDKYYRGNDEVLSEMNVGDFKAGEFLGGIAHSVGFMLPSIMTAGAGAAAGAGSAAQKGISLATLGLGAGGKGSEEALNEGASAGQALGYGAASGAAEVASEMVVGPILAKAGLGTGNINGFGSRTIKELAKSAFEEGMEEVSTASIEPLLKSIYKGEGALDEYKNPAKFVLGIGGDFNESVAGQFASGAVSGGIMSGISVYQKNKAFGKASAVVDSMGEARESYVKMLQYKKGTAQYAKYQEETFKNIGEAYKAWNEAKDGVSETQLRNLQKYIQNPAEFTQSLKSNTSAAEVVNNYMNEINSEDLNKFGLKEVGSEILKMVDEDGYVIKFGKVKGNNNAQISTKTKTITINSNLSSRAGSLLAHEFGVHALAKSIGSEEINKLYNKISKSDWFESAEGKRVQELYENNKKFKEEVVANYIEDVVAKKGDNQTQLQYVKSLFERPSFIRRAMRLFNKNLVNFQSNDAIESEFRKTIQTIVKGSNNKTYKAIIKKLSKGEKLTSDEAVIYRGLKPVFDLFSKDRTETDSKGNELSKQQQEFFKDSKARDKEGRLVPVYHYSNTSEQFYVFDKAHNDKLNKEPQNGFYFSNKETVAKTYQKTEITKVNDFSSSIELAKKFGIDLKFDTNTGEFNMKKILLDCFDDKISTRQLLDFLTEFYGDQVWSIQLFDVEENEITSKKELENVDQSDLVLEVYDISEIGSYVLSASTFGKSTDETRVYNGVGFEVYLNLANPLIIDGKGAEWSRIPIPFEIGHDNKASTRQIAKYAKERGFDGVIFKNVYDLGANWLKDKNGKDVPYSKYKNKAKSDIYVAFESNQIKNIDNKTPTENNDIRYSKNRVLGNYTVGDNKSKLKVRFASKGGYEVYFPAEERTITEAEIGGEWAKNEKGIETRVNGKKIKFDSEANVLKYLNDIGAKPVEKVKSDKPKQKLTPQRTIEIKGEDVDSKLKKADNGKLKRVSFRKNVYVNDGSRVFKYVIKKIETNKYHVSYENADGEMVERDYSYKELRSEIDSYTRASNNRADVLDKPKTKEKLAKVQQKKEKVEVKKSKTIETKVEEKPKEKKKTTYISYKDFADAINKSIEATQETLGDGFKVVTPINLQDFAKRAFTDVQSVRETQNAAKRMVNKLLETRIENSDRQLVGTLEEMLDDKQIKNLNTAIEEIIKSAPNTEARNAAERNVRILLEKAQAEAKEFKSGQSRTRVLVRLRDRIRKNITRFHQITNDEIIKNGLYTLFDPFEKLHGTDNGGFAAKDFRDNLAKALEWYTEENLSEKYEGLIYNDAVRVALEDIYNSIGVGVETANGTVRKNLTAETMQKAIEAIRLINDDVKRMIINYTNTIAPASVQTKKAIKRSNYGARSNVLAKMFRMYKRGFAPSYVLIEEMLGGNSEAVKILVTDMQVATNEKIAYLGAYHDEINKKLKELGIKKTFDTKKMSFRGTDFTIDQLMGLYISTKVEANYNAINEDGVVVYDNKNRKMVDIAGKGEAEALKTEVNNILPDEYKKFADWLLDTMNDSVKSEYIKWFEDKFGKYQMRNEIGKIKENAYWSLKRSYQKMDNLSKAISNPDALFSHAIRRTKGGHNAVMLTGALGTFDAYVDKLGRELYIKPKYENALSVLNTKGIDGQSVMDVIARRNDGSKDIALLREITADILGAKTRQANLLDKMVSAFSVAKLSLNIGSMAKQFASAFTSNIPISKTAKALIQRWSPEARSEFKTLFDEIGGLKYREASKGVLRANADSVGQFAEKVARVGMIGISKVDLFTVSTGVYSLMVIGQDQFDAKIGTQENIDFVKEHWQEYELSQIGNTALSRNAISRGEGLVRYLFGFLQGANRAALGSQIHKYGLWERNRNVDEKQLRSDLKEAETRLEKARNAYEADQDNESARKEFIETNAEVIDLNNRIRDFNSYKIAGGKMILPNMASGIIAQGILVALVNALMKRIKGKKDWGELKLSEEGLALAMSIGVDWIPLVNFISNIVQGYEVDIPATNLLNQFASIFKTGANQDWDKMIRQIVWLAGDMTGIPFQTLYDYVYGAVKFFDPETAYEFRSIFYGSTLQSATSTMKTYADKGNVSKTASMIDLIMKKFKTGSSNDEINKELASLYIAGYNALPKGTMTEYESVKLSAQQITQFTNEYEKSTSAVDKLLRMSEYKSLTAEEKSKAIKKLYDAYYSMAQAKTVGSKPEGKLAQMLVLTNGNIDLAKYVIYLQKVGQITDSAKKTRKELVLEYINKLRGFSKAEKAMLMYLAGYKVSGTSATSLSTLSIRNGASREDVKALLG